ncbi:MAG: DUF5672 family protein [Kiritimatiellae bacterium]|nr:DUF5672 family protein [Kiritimatiellia bacterium]
MSAPPLTTNHPEARLRAWLRGRLALPSAAPSNPGTSEVTLAAYHFYPLASFDTEWDCLEAAIRETWRQCGLLHSVVIANRITRKLEDFAASSDGFVRIELCEHLIPGDLYSMSIDCISNLYKRFDTPYVLIIQNDGFPIRPGLESFLKTPCDYWGAPWPQEKDDWITRLLLHHRSQVGNGGFSLRSRRICEMASRYHQRKYKYLPSCYFMTEDYFFCKTLPTLEKEYRNSIITASPEAAASFSLEEHVALYRSLKTKPFGFHSARAFVQLQKDGLIPICPV